RPHGWRGSPLPGGEMIVAANLLSSVPRLGGAVTRADVLAMLARARAALFPPQDTAGPQEVADPTYDPPPPEVADPTYDPPPQEVADPTYDPPPQDAADETYDLPPQNTAAPAGTGPESLAPENWGLEEEPEAKTDASPLFLAAGAALLLYLSFK